jgi:hypothetical protein
MVWAQKSKYAGLGQEKWFCSCTFAHFAEADKRYSKDLHLLKKECNKYDLIVASWF